jgi:dihydropteroate synthase
MGILNVTPDSFFDGGRYVEVAAAVARAWQIVLDGAGILDIGAESTRPGAPPVEPDEQIARLVPVMEALADPKGPRGAFPLPISVDTTSSEVARRALDAGACIVNDVTAGESDPRILDVVAQAGAAIVLMHMRGEPRDMQQRTDYADVMAEVGDHLAARCSAAERAGIPPEHQAVDPGIGFSKTPDGCVELIGRLSELRRLGRPILLGASRKSFLGRRFGLEGDARLPGSLAAAVLGLANGADILRVHDVAQTAAAIQVAHGILEWTPDRRRSTEADRP